MENDLIVGDIVISLKGHDMDCPFLVVDIDKFHNIAIIDGKTRLKNKPKIKNPKHLKKVGHSDDLIEKFKSPIVTDAEIYKLIKIYKEVKE